MGLSDIKCDHVEASQSDQASQSDHPGFRKPPACRHPWTETEESWLRDWVHTHVCSPSYSGRIDWRSCSMMCKAQVCCTLSFSIPALMFSERCYVLTTNLI
jgi:hypothetical protein